MIILENISKAFGYRGLLKNINYTCPVKARIALIGNNGEGKTTLLNIICGFDTEFDGKVIKPKTLRLGYLPQIANPYPKTTILKEALDGADELNEIISERDQLLEEMTKDYSQDKFDRYEILEQKFQHLEGYKIEEDVKKLLKGFGFDEEQFEEPVDMLSGGWRMRLEFVKMLINRPNFLVLDEPTNHLDLPSIEWFESYLKDFDGTVLFVSHDKDLLNRLATHILHLKQGKLTSYVGNFDAFLDAFTLKQSQNAKFEKHLQDQYTHIEKFVDRFRYKPSKARQVQSRLKMLTKLKALETDIEFDNLSETMNLRLDNPTPSGKFVVKADKLEIGYDYALIKPLSFNIVKGNRVAILGANGLGKSTLLKTLLGRQKPLGGSIESGHNVIPGYFAQEHLEGLQEGLTIIENLNDAAPNMKELEIRSLLASLGISGDDIFKPVRVLSGGEKSRVALASILAQKPNTLFLDEPTNHLDLSACENLANALCEFTGTVIFVSHNRSFIHTVATHQLYLKKYQKVHLEEV
ncbi:MAG: ABC-F family ATP-binding cassette domain-containing protein [Alphaproteobacteria bacterium]|nr:MAG: ABC-F family ATP-binding cassette domain-containing protein [Alphaproteobacteria bacterium]